MEIKQLTYFLRIAEEGNITRAAEKLYIAQPHLSNHLKLLENELGVKLVERNTHRIKLTNAGEVLRHRALQILELVNSTVKELKDIEDGLKGTLSIGTISSAGDIILPDIIYNFHTQYPNVNFKVMEAVTPEVLELLNNGVIEVGIVRGEINSELYEQITLTEEPMIAIESGELFCDDTSDGIDMRNLQDKPLLIHSRYENMILEACARWGFEPRILGKIEDTRSILSWAERGMGVAVVPRDWLSLITGTKLKYIEIHETGLITKTAMAWKKGNYLSSAARHFLESCDRSIVF